MTAPTRTQAAPIDGTCDPAFRALKSAFIENFEVDQDIGASCCVVLEGRLVVDLWGGHKTADRVAPWARDTIVTMMSVAKGFNAIVIQMLVDRGLIDCNAPVAKYWPEFAQANKEEILVRHLLDHRAGLEVIDDPLWPGAVYNWNVFVDAIERQSPSHEPGTFPAYHPVSVGFTTGELVRRLTGKSYARILREFITGPLGIDFQVGLPQPDLQRCARFTKGPVYTDAGNQPSPLSPLLRKAMAQFDPQRDDDFNSEQFRFAEIPSINGHGNARSVASFFGMLALDDGSLISSEALARVSEIQWSGIDATLGHNIHMGLGVRRNCPDAYMGPNAAAWGHPGAGGSIGFCDPDAKIGFSYGMNLMRPTRNVGPRARRLVTRCTLVSSRWSIAAGMGRQSIVFGAGSQDSGVDLVSGTGGFDGLRVSDAGRGGYGCTSRYRASNCGRAGRGWVRRRSARRRGG
jgi:CubicO group peptidase (beta-lactamase class C family)